MALNEETKNNIETKAADILLDAYGMSVENIVPPIDLGKILERYDLKLKIGEFPDSNISGAYDEESKTIYIAKNEIKQRRLFTVAHELGHFFLHNDVRKYDVYFRSQQLNLVEEDKDHERQANWFAASLLMPEPLVIKAWQVLQDQQKIADVFGVSAQSAYYRLKNLNLVE